MQLVAAVRALSQADRVIVLGSSSLLGTDPNLGGPDQPLEISYDADLLLEPLDEETGRIIHEATGEGSFYHRRHACFADVLRPEITETLPNGWQARLVALPGQPQVFCLDPHDLALVKLALGRTKDMQLLRELLSRGILNEATLRGRFQALTWDERRTASAGRNLGLLLGRT